MSLRDNRDKHLSAKACGLTCPLPPGDRGVRLVLFNQVNEELIAVIEPELPDRSVLGRELGERVAQHGVTRGVAGGATRRDSFTCAGEHICQYVIRIRECIPVGPTYGIRSYSFLGVAYSESLR